MQRHLQHVSNTYLSAWNPCTRLISYGPAAAQHLVLLHAVKMMLWYKNGHARHDAMLGTNVKSQGQVQKK